MAMRNTNRQPTLKRTYYRSFLLMVVIPLVLVFVCAEVVVSYIIRNSAIETIDALQENLATALSGDVRNNALQLSHFVYANDGEFIQMAVQVHQSGGGDWYVADQIMQRAFRTAMVPSQDILVGAFYMDRAGTVYMKDEVAIPEGEIRGTDWYRRAEERPNSVVLGCYDTSRTRVVQTSQQNRQMVLVTAMATDTATDRTGAVEVVSLFTVSQVGDILAGQRKDAILGRSVIPDRDGHVIFGDMGDDAVRDYFEDRLGRFTPGSLTRRAALAEDGGERDYFFRTRTIPDTDWSVVTFVEESGLGQQFYQVGGILALIVIGLMTLFYFYSRYFLNAIIAPVQEVCRGMERLDRNDLEVQLEPKGQRELQDLMTSFNQMVLSIKHMLRLTEETLPILVTVFAAFKTRADMVNTSPLALPPEPTLENFKEVLTNKRLITGVKNTLLILAVSLFFNTLLGTITAYIIERFNFRFKKVVVALFFVGMLVPTFVTEIARFKIINGLGLYGSPGAPILIYVASDLMQLYIYRQFLSNLSTSLDESALLDGCNYFQLFTKIIFPLLAPATATVAIIMLPTVVLYVFFQKYILAGVAAGAVKE